MRVHIMTAAILTAYLAGCAAPLRPPPAQQGSRHSQRFQQPPDRAAACFARNAEEHSSALVAEIMPGGDSAHVLVSVKNGVPYATADFRRSGGGSTGTITLNVRTTGSRNDLIEALVEGC